MAKGAGLATLVVAFSVWFRTSQLILRGFVFCCIFVLIIVGYSFASPFQKMASRIFELSSETRSQYSYQPFKSYSMSFVNASLPIQKFISNYGNTSRTYNVLRYVQETSRRNTAVDIDPNTFLAGGQGGKLRDVKLNHFPVICDVDGDCNANICEGGEELGPRQTMFTVGRCVASKVYSIAKGNVRLTDAGEWDFSGIGRQIVNSILPALRAELANEWLSILYSMAGVHADGSEWGQRVSVVNPNTGVVNAMGFNTIYREYLDSGLEQPNIIGGGDVYALERMVQIGGQNQFGQNIAAVNTDGVYYDDGLGGRILGNANGDPLLAISPNVFKYIYFLENAGIFATDGVSGIESFNALMMRGAESYINTVFIDPVTGIPFDLDIYMSACGKKISFQLKHIYDFFIAPDVACNIQGLNGIMKYRSCPAVEVTCPTGSPIPSPAAPTGFSWTPGDIFPVYAATLSIGGVENQPNVNITDIAGLVAMLNDSYGNIFSASGSTVHYSGYSALSGNINGNINITFS